MAQSTKIQKGTFVGEGHKYVTIPCDFYPDIIMVNLILPDPSDLDTFRGVITDVVWRDECSFSVYDNNASTTSLLYYGNIAANGMADYNEQTTANRNCHAVVTGTSVTIDRETTLGVYPSGYTYEYVFIKLPD